MELPKIKLIVQLPAFSDEFYGGERFNCLHLSLIIFLNIPQLLCKSNAVDCFIAMQCDMVYTSNLSYHITYYSNKKKTAKGEEVSLKISKYITETSMILDLKLAF